MELSVVVARIFAVIYIASGLAVIRNKVDFRAVAEELEKSTLLLFFAGVLGVIFGTILISYHNNWEKNWTLLITLFGWAMLTGGLSVIVFPEMISYMKKFYRHSPAYGLMMIALGLLLGYFGFFM